MDYYEGLKKSEWKGEVDIMETKGEGHCFHFFNPMSEKAVAIVDKLVGFLKQGYLLGFILRLFLTEFWFFSSYI
ncbi:hypothetical protein P3L10_002456 [Capsicum annuum]